MTYNPKIKNTAANKVTIEADINATNINLGVAEDDNNNPAGAPTYLDGLFSFDTETTVGVAIDKINEVLAGLAPPPANTLSTLNTPNNGELEYLGLQSGDMGTTVVSELSPRLPAVGEKAQFAKIVSSDNNFERLGTLSVFEEINIVLNGTFEQNLQGDQVNFPADAFNTTSSPKQASDIKVFLNDIDITSNVTVSFRTESSGKFASAEEFPIFKHNTGTVTVHNTSNVTSFWRKGHNYIQVKYGENNSSETAHIDWVYAPDEANINSYIMNLQSLTYESNTGTPKYISGIPYVEDLKIKLATGTNQVENYAIQSYPTNYGFTILADGVPTNGAFSNKVASSFAGSEIIATDVSLQNNTLDVSNTSIAANANSMILGDSLSFIYKVTNAHGKNGEETKTTTEKFLFDSNSTVAQPRYLTTNPVFEDFINETRRVSTDTDNSDTYIYPSNAPLVAGQAAVYGGKLGHSSRIPTFSDVSVPSATKPDYSTRTGNEEFMRVYRHSSALAKIRFKITCSSNAVFGATNNVIQVQFRDGSGAWKDATNASTLGGIAFNSPIAYNISNPQTGTTRLMDIDFGAGGINLDTDAYFKIIFPNNNVGTIDKIEVVAINN